jgi:pseudaminic acid biosynthesis-associated methylase
MDKPLDYWTNNAPYHERINDNEEQKGRMDMWRFILGSTKGFETVLEVGAGTGNNLLCLRELASVVTQPDQIVAIEPNQLARKHLNKRGFTAIDGKAQKLPFEDGHFDVVFTSGLLIHIPPDDLLKVMSEIVRVSNKYVVCIEYFNAYPVEVEYRGSYIWKRDFGTMYMDNFPLAPLNYGFEWKTLTGLDNLTWWLFEKD